MQLAVRNLVSSYQRLSLSTLRGFRGVTSEVLVNGRRMVALTCKLERPIAWRDRAYGQEFARLTRIGCCRDISMITEEDREKWRTRSEEGKEDAQV